MLATSQSFTAGATAVASLGHPLTRALLLLTTGLVDAVTRRASPSISWWGGPAGATLVAYAGLAGED